MSSEKSSLFHQSPLKKMRLSLLRAGILFSLTSLSFNVLATCDYTVTGQWDNGFNGQIKITNSGNSPVSAWKINWTYAGNNRITSLYNGALTGSNPYTVDSFNWNGNISPGQSVTVGFNGTKSNGAAEVPVVKGDLCENAVSSISSSSKTSNSTITTSASKTSSSSSSSQPATSSSRPSSSMTSSSVATSRSSSSSVTLSSQPSSAVASSSAVVWPMTTSLSRLNFTTTKNTNNVEVQTFNTISGGINFSTNMATLVIDLNSVNTTNTIRDENIRTKLFETSTFPTATVTLPLESNFLNTLPAGQSKIIDVNATLNFHGVNGSVVSKVSVLRLSNKRLLVKSYSPILLKTGDYSLAAGLETLRALVGLQSIGTVVPVDFALFFDAPN